MSKANQRKYKPLFWQIYTPNLILSLVGLLFISIISCLAFRSFSYVQSENDLRARVVLTKKIIRQTLKDGSVRKLQKLTEELAIDTRTRWTVIDKKGKVLADSHTNPKRMENHSSRPEVREAIRQGEGIAVRYSDTIKEDFMYLAMPIILKGKTQVLLRGSISIRSLIELLWEVYINVAITLCTLFIIVTFQSWRMLKKSLRGVTSMVEEAEGIRSGELDTKISLDNKNSKEFRLLTRTLNDLLEDLRDRIAHSEEKQQELSTVIKSMKDALIVVDPDEKIYLINDRAARFFAIDPEACVGKKIRRLLQFPEFNEHVTECLLTGEFNKKEFSFTTDLGKTIQLQVRSNPLPGVFPKGFGGVFLLTDVTAIRMLEEHRKDFIANVSHELKTPLTSIQGFIETLLNPNVSNRDDQVRFMKIIQKQAILLDQLVNDILILSKLDKKDELLKPDIQSNVVNNTILSAIDLCQQAASKKNCTIKKAFSQKVVAAAYDDRLIEQAVANLINNAIKYGPEENVVIVDLATEGDDVVITVEDKGHGIEAHHLPRLFERFYRVDKARSRDVGGTGLGLAIVKNIALVHLGNVSVESERSVGSTFTLKFPISIKKEPVKTSPSPEINA